MTPPADDLMAAAETGAPDAPEQDARAFTGWVRLDSDNVIRGWVTDRNDRALRSSVDIVIDDAPVARLVANAPDPKLQELGEGDGRYAFALVLPERFRDAQPHRLEAFAESRAYRLKSKAETFQVEASSTPEIEVAGVGYGSAEGRVRGGQYTKSVTLELWRDGVRVDTPVETQWSGPTGDRLFRATFAPDVLDGDGELVLAAPGMIEAGLAGAPIALTMRLEAQLHQDGALSLQLKEGATLVEARALELRVYHRGEAEPAFVKSVSAVGGEVRARLPESLLGPPLVVRLAVDGREPPSLSIEPRRTLGRVTRNSAFQRWEAVAPADWTPAEGIARIDRGFYGFPGRVAKAHGVSGDFVRLSLDEGGGERPLLRQPLEAPVSTGDEVEAGLLVRASGPATVRLRLEDEAGEAVATVAATVRRPWVWTHVAEPMQAGRPLGSAVAAITVETEDGAAVVVDVAGARLGAGPFDDPVAEAAAPPAQGARPSVDNADLRDWPNGVVMKSAGRRMETARGWFVVNRGTKAPVFASAMVGEEDPNTVGYAVAADEVPDVVRLEVRLDPAAVQGLTQGIISFEAASTAAARRLLNAAQGGAPEFVLVDRISIVRRGEEAVGDSFNVVTETLGTAVRRLLVTRRFHRFELPVTLTAKARAPDFDWDELGIAPPEYFLIFELRQPFAITLRRLSLDAAPVASADQPDGYLALEDRNIAAQADYMRGLESWLSPAPVRWEDAPEAAPQPSAAPLRWSWALADAGTVEVVICVHNAVEETLACLQSLVGSTRVPHTVSIIDDASELTVRRRLEAFVADKPWMRLSTNAANQGYTASADQGVRGSEADWVVLMNSDTVATPGWLEGMLEVAAADPRVAFVGPLSNAATFQSVPEIYNEANRFKVNALPPGWTPAQMAELVASCSQKAFPEAPLLNGFCTLMRRSVFVEVGGLNRGAFPSGYGEENDLCTRVVKAGYKLAIADHVYVYHSKSASFGGARRDELAKAGSRALKKLHPDTDYGDVVSGFRDIPALVQLRAALNDALKDLS